MLFFLHDSSLFNYSLLTLFLIAPPTFIFLTFLQAPYGKHHRPGWGPNLSPPLAWFLMESPTLWFTFYLFPHGKNSSNPKSKLLITFFLVHYFNRTIIYPLRLFFTKTTKNPSGFPFSIAVIAFLFNLLNSFVQARWVSHYKDFVDGWSFWVVFFCGVVVFFVGMMINVLSDEELLRLKSEGKGYLIPKGGLFEFVSCPNYFGEIVEWFGWALMTWSWAGLGFFVYTFANLGPRARANHQWYLEKFGEDYPKKRKALKLRWFSSKSVVKYPRCSIRRQSTYADAEEDLSMALALASTWTMFLAFGSLACIGPISYTVGMAYQNAFSSGLSYSSQPSAFGFLASVNSIMFIVLGFVIGYPVASASVNVLQGLWRNDLVSLKGACPNCGEEVFAFVRMDRNSDSPHRTDCHVCECLLEFRTNVERSVSRFGRQWVYGRIYLISLRGRFRRQRQP